MERSGQSIIIVHVLFHGRELACNAGLYETDITHYMSYMKLIQSRLACNAAGLAVIKKLDLYHGPNWREAMLIIKTCHMWFNLVHMRWPNCNHQYQLGFLNE